MAQRTDFAAMACSLARSWAVIGEPWTPLILRDLTLGMRRFDELQADLGIARNVLADRLKTLEHAGVVSRQRYRSANRNREEYVLTEMGAELLPIIVGVIQWGDRWLDREASGPPITFMHTCGAATQARTVCASCGEDITAENTAAVAGPGSRTGPGTHHADRLPKASGART